MTATPKNKKQQRKPSRKKKKKKVGKSTATILIISIAVLIALLALGVILYLSPHTHECASPMPYEEPITNYNTTFHDIHSVQKPAAEACGISPITDADTAAYIASGGSSNSHPTTFTISTM